MMFLQTILQHPKGPSALKRAIPWADLATFLTRTSHWAMRGMARVGRVEGNDGRLMDKDIGHTRRRIH
jgi:hypothetical protein